VLRAVKNNLRSDREGRPAPSLRSARRGGFAVFAGLSMPPRARAGVRLIAVGYAEERA